MNIGFYSNQLSFRGTEVAMFDYAYYNETLLKNKSFIFYEKNNLNNDIDVIKKFNNFFTTIPLNNFHDIDEYLQKNNIQILYNIKSGKNDGKISKIAKNFIHCVFNSNEPHGEIYSTISSWVSRNNNKLPVLPHIVHLPENNDNMREILNIPNDAIVFGRYGGMDTFNLEEAHRAIRNVVRAYDNIYFVFINTPHFDEHRQVIFLNKIINDDDKNKFIHTCDAHLECSNLGHTFGLAIGEFSVNNKPIIAYNGWVWNRCHLDILGDKGIYFKTEDELYQILTTFDKSKYVHEELNCYKEFSPENVMKIFKEVFVDEN